MYLEAGFRNFSRKNQKILEHQSVGIISQLSKIDLKDIDTNFLEFEDEGNSHPTKTFFSPTKLLPVGYWR